MQLVGMLDSPYVRRVAVALLTAEVRFEHKPVSLFRHMDAFAALSPMLKAPSLVLDDGSVLVESSVILEYLGLRFSAVAALRPRGAEGFRVLGAALTVMEKSVQLHYERALRGAGEQSPSWRERVTRQLQAGLASLEATSLDGWAEGDPGHADIALACAVRFLLTMLSDIFALTEYPRLLAFSARAEALPAFLAAPPVDGATVAHKTRLA